MCTVTWWRSAEGYELFFNRDEQRSRAPAEPPSMHKAGNVSYLAPTDPQGGGTWMGVNAYGLTLCVLNYTDPSLQAAAPKDPTSRGLILPSLFDATRVDQLEDRLAAMRLCEYAPFQLLAVDHKHESLWTWTGTALERRAKEAIPQPVTTSSYKPQEVVPTRKKTYQEMVGSAAPTTETLLSFHRSHLPERSAHSVCMHRDDARTVSFSRVICTKEEVRFAYAPRPACELSPHGMTELESKDIRQDQQDLRDEETRRITRI